MTDEKYEKAHEIKRQIKVMQLALERNFEGLYYCTKPYCEKLTIELDRITLTKIRVELSKRLEELKKEFEEL